MDECRAKDPYTRTQSTTTRYGGNRDAWVANTREVLEKTQEAKRSTWRAILEEVTRTKDAKKAWAVVKSLNGSAQAQDGKTLVYKGREYVSDKAMASTFIQEYATVSGRKSDRSSRRDVRELRSGVRRLLGSPRQELEQASTPEDCQGGKGWWPRRRGSWLTQTPSTEHAKRTYVFPERELDYGMVPTGLVNRDDCPVFKERERPTSCEQLSPYCSYVHHQEIAWATHCQSPKLVVGGEVAPQPVSSRVPQAPMYHRPMPLIVPVR